MRFSESGEDGTSTSGAARISRKVTTAATWPSGTGSYDISSSLPAKLVGRGTAERQLGGGGANCIRRAAPPPSNLRSMVPLPIASQQGGYSFPLRQRRQAHQDGIDVAPGL